MTKQDVRRPRASREALARIADGAVVLDPRTVEPDADAGLRGAIAALIA